MPEKIGEMYIELKARTEKLEASLKKLKGTAKTDGKKVGKDFGSSFKSGLLAAGIGIALKKAFDFSIILKNVARDGEEIRSKFDTVFESMVAGANRVADAFSKEFKLADITTRELLGATGDLLVGFGFSEQAALDMSVEVNRLAQDLASFTNFAGGSTGASNALTKAILGETESVKALGIVLRQNTVDFKQQMKSTMQLQGVDENQARAIVLLKEAYRQSGKAVGDFERTQDSLANQERILEEQFKNLQEVLGNELVPIFLDLTESMKNALQGFSDFNMGLKEFTGLGDIEKGVGVIQNLMNAVALSMGKGGFLLDEYKDKLMDVHENAEKVKEEHNLMGQSLHAGRQVTIDLIRASREWKEETTKIVSEVNAVRLEIGRLKKLQKEGNLTLLEYQNIDALILEQKKLLTGEIEKQVTGMNAMLSLAIQYNDKAKSAGLTPYGEMVKKGKAEIVETIDVSDLISPAEIIAEYFKNVEESAGNTDQKFASVVNAGLNLASILSIGADTFVGKLFDGLNQVNQMANSILGIVSAFAGGSSGGLFGLIFGHAGGNFRGTSAGVKKMAGGGSFTVPPGFSNDSFPLMVESGERVSVTSSTKTTRQDNLLQKISTGINNIIENGIIGQENKTPTQLQINMDGRKIAEEVFYQENRDTENTFNKGDIR